MVEVTKTSQSRQRRPGCNRNRKTKIKMRKLFLTVLILGAIGAYFIYAISQNLQTERNDVSNVPHVMPTSLSIAVIGDTGLAKSVGVAVNEM